MNLYIGIHPDDENILTLTDFHGRRVLVFEKDFSNTKTAKIISAANVLSDALETCFIDMGKAGANGLINHPLREAWEKARAALKIAGKL
jgi:TRAP-type uncharacterized transport system substrate-binding protein